MNNKKRFITLMVFVLAASIFPFGVSYAGDELENNISLEIDADGKPSLSEENATGSGGKSDELSLWGLIKKGGVVGYLIIFLSVISLGLIIDYSFTIRKSKIVPPNDMTVLKDLIKDRKIKDAVKLDNGKASFISKVAIAGLNESHRGYRTMIKAMEDASEALTAGFSRRIEHLNVIGNISPMLGLLGTVIGMLRCFNEISHMAGAIEPKQLAGGIFEALVTTCMGLIVAIPSLYCYAIFRNRIDEYTGEAALEAEQLMSSFKADVKEE